MILRQRSVPILTMALGMVVAPTLSIYYPRAMALVCTIVALAALAYGWRRRAWAAPHRPLAAAMAALLGWALLSTLWALDVGWALKDMVSLTSLALLTLGAVSAAGRMDEADRRALLWAIVAGMTVALAFTTMELVFDGVLLRYRTTYTYDVSTVMKPGNTVALVLLAPATAALITLERRRLALAFALVGMTVLFFTYSDAARLGLAAMVVAGVLMLVAPRVGRMAVMAGVAVAVMGMSTAAYLLPPPQQMWESFPHLRNSAHHRLHIWHFVGQRIAEHPVLGWGLNSSRVMPGAEEKTIFTRIHPDGTPENFEESNLPLHPHNAPLQWWLELGGVGAALMTALIVVLTRLGARAMPDRTRRALAVATVVAAVTVSLTAYGAWQAWWLSIMALAGITLTLARGPAEKG